MKVLGIESSCDETSAAVVEDGKRLLSNVVNSQIDIHSIYGGVIPEIAARSHLEVINPVVDKALADAGCTWDDIDAIAVTYAPGLVGSLLIGTLAARTLAVLRNKPLYPIHHVEAHVYANFITEQAINKKDRGPTPKEALVSPGGGSFPSLCTEDLPFGPTGGSSAGAKDGKVTTTRREPAGSLGFGPTKFELPKSQPKFPMLALIVSGGHSQLVLFRDHGDYELLGQTQDDAVGEAFDKVAKILGLPYPGGPSISAAAKLGNAEKYALPKSKLQNPYDFSFSGLKTAVLRAVQREVGKDFTFPSHELPGLLTASQRNDFAASFQKIAVETLVDKTLAAFDEFQPASVVIAGGVAANLELRQQLSNRLPIAIEYAPMSLCTDNAAMIATLGYFYARSVKPADPLLLEVVPSLSMTKTAWKL